MQTCSPPSQELAVSFSSLVCTLARKVKGLEKQSGRTERIKPSDATAWRQWYTNVCTN